jgi:nucleoside-diphosphate-sugar epimerase
MVIEAKRVLITGGAGFIGFRAAELLSENNKVTVVDNFLRREPDEKFKSLVQSGGVELIEGDLSSSEFVSTLPEVDFVFHFAALNGTSNFYEYPFSVIKAATLPTLNLLERYSGSGIERFVFSGTSESYAGAIDKFSWPVPTSEDVPLVITDVRSSRWSYAAGKTASEAMVFAANSQFGIPISVVRFHNVYGPRMGNKHVIPEFINRAKSSVYSLYGSDNRRSFIFVDDAVLATALVASSSRTQGEVVHIGTSEEVSMLELAQKIMKLGGWKGELAIFDAPEGSVSRRQPDTTKLFELTGFRPAVDLDEGLGRTLTYYLKNVD